MSQKNLRVSAPSLTPCSQKSRQQVVNYFNRKGGSFVWLIFSRAVLPASDSMELGTGTELQPLPLRAKQTGDCPWEQLPQPSLASTACLF